MSSYTTSPDIIRFADTEQSERTVVAVRLHFSGQTGNTGHIYGKLFSANRSRRLQHCKRCPSSNCLQSRLRFKRHDHSVNMFTSRFNNKTAAIIRRFTRYLLRRTKADMQHMIELPAKNEQVLFCHLCDEQKNDYIKYLRSTECTEILNSHTNIFKALVHLRKLCNHADLVNPLYHDSISTNSVDSYGYYKRSGRFSLIWLC